MAEDGNKPSRRTARHAAPAEPESVPVAPTDNASVASPKYHLEAVNLAVGSPGIGQPSASYPEFVVMMLEAVRHFRINAPAGEYPKKEDLVSWFKGRRLSSGNYVSPSQAEHLATFCRPVVAMKGGNKKVGG
jgi:hypothetical protein